MPPTIGPLFAVFSLRAAFGGPSILFDYPGVLNVISLFPLVYPS